MMHGAYNVKFISSCFHVPEMKQATDRRDNVNTVMNPWIPQKAGNV